MTRDDAREKKRAQPPLPSVDTRRKGEHVLAAGDEPARLNDDPGGPAYTTSVRERAPEPDPNQGELAALLALNRAEARSAIERLRDSPTPLAELVPRALASEAPSVDRCVTTAEPRPAPRPPASSRRSRASKGAARGRRRELRALERARKRDEHVALVRSRGADGYDPLDFTPRAYGIARTLQSEAWETHDDGQREHVAARKARAMIEELPRELFVHAEVACLTRDGNPGPLVRTWECPVARKTLTLCLVLFYMGKSSSREGVRRCAGGFTESMLARLLARPGKRSLSLSRVRGLGKKSPGEAEYRDVGYVQRLKRSGFVNVEQMRGRRLLARFPQFFGPPKRIKLRSGQTVLRRFGFNRYDFPSSHFRAELSDRARELVRLCRAPGPAEAAQGPPASRAGP